MSPKAFTALVLLARLCALASIGLPANAAGWAQNQFLITFWSPPPATDENLTRVAAEGFNLTWTAVEGLEVAARHGLRAMLTSDLLKSATLDDPAKCAQLDALIKRVKNHPALEAYFLIDEPGAEAFPGLARLVAHLRELDPAHLAYINLFPTYASAEQLGVSTAAAEQARRTFPAIFADIGADDEIALRYREYLRQFTTTIQPDLLSYDHYHFLKEKDGEQYFLNLSLIRQTALEVRRPFLNIIQADTIEKTWRLPNANEMRWLAFTTMAYGGRGISYFTYWGPRDYNGLYVDGKPRPLLGAVAALNHEILRFGPALMELNSVGVYHSAPLPLGTEGIPAQCPVQITGQGEFVLGLFGQDSQPAAFMIVNRNYKQPIKARAVVAIPGRKLEELDRTTGRWVRRQSLRGKRIVKLKLAPGDGRLFRVVN